MHCSYCYQLKFFTRTKCYSCILCNHCKIHTPVCKCLHFSSWMWELMRTFPTAFLQMVTWAPVPRGRLTARVLRPVSCEILRAPWFHFDCKRSVFMPAAVQTGSVYISFSHHFLCKHKLLHPFKDTLQSHKNLPILYLHRATKFLIYSGFQDFFDSYSNSFAVCLIVIFQDKIS